MHGFRPNARAFTVDYERVVPSGTAPDVLFEGSLEGQSKGVGFGVRVRVSQSARTRFVRMAVPKPDRNAVAGLTAGLGTLCSLFRRRHAIGTAVGTPYSELPLCASRVAVTRSVTGRLQLQTHTSRVFGFTNAFHMLHCRLTAGLSGCCPGAVHCASKQRPSNVRGSRRNQRSAAPSGHSHGSGCARRSSGG